MAAIVHRLRTRREKLQAEEAAQLRQHMLAFDDFVLPEEAVRQVIGAIDRLTAANNGWTFVMLSPSQNAAVVRWLGKHSARPKIAVQLWAEMLCALRIDTGEVLLDRGQLAAAVEARPTEVSEILGELERIGAISKKRQRVAGMRGAGRVAVFVNPLVATHLAGAARTQAQDAATPVGRGGKQKRDSNDNRAPGPRPVAS